MLSVFRTFQRFGDPNGHPLATRVDGTLYYVHSDFPSTSSGRGLGSTVALSNADGAAVGRVQYDPYGEVLTSTLPADLTDRLFTGQRPDSSTALYTGPEKLNRL